LPAAVVESMVNGRLLPSWATTSVDRSESEWDNRAGWNPVCVVFQRRGSRDGPHPVSQDALRAAFTLSTGRNFVTIRPELVQTRIRIDGAPAWFATIKRL
jgi:hypothetical protein